MAVETVVSTWGGGGVSAMGGVVILTGTTATWGPGGMEPLDGSSSPTRTAYETSVPYGGTVRPTVGLLYPRYSRPFTPVGL